MTLAIDCEIEIDCTVYIRKHTAQ